MAFIIEVAISWRSQLADAAADGDPVTDWQHADLDPRVSSERLVEFQHEVPVIPDVLPEGSIRWCHDRSVPQGVVVPDHSTNFHQVDQPFVVVYVVVLVSVHENKIE